MATSGKSGRAARKPAKREAAPTARPPLAHRLALAFLGAAVLLVPLVFDAASRDGFRLPKALVLQTTILASLLLLAVARAEAASGESAPAALGEGAPAAPSEGAPAWKRLLRSPAALAIAPFLVVATLAALASPHGEHVARALPGYWIVGAAVVGWSAGFSRAELSRALSWSMLPAVLLALVGILQFHDLYQPFEFERLRESSRLAITSLAGNAGDLAAFLVLPALVAQRRLAAGEGRLGPGIVLGLALYGIAITQTIAAAAALALATLVFWTAALVGRRRWIALAVTGAFVLGALAVSAPFRARAVEKARELARGDWNELLTGRLDGWRAGLWMIRERPASGVGPGAYRAEFLSAKEKLLDRGVRFFAEQQNVVFANAHNEPIEVGAELGVPGLLALAWAVLLVARRSRGASPIGEPGHVDRSFAWAALAAIGVLSTFHFPFRIAIVAGQILLFLAWLFADEEVAP